MYNGRGHVPGCPWRGEQAVCGAGVFGDSKKTSLDTAQRSQTIERGDGRSGGQPRGEAMGF